MIDADADQTVVETKKLDPPTPMEPSMTRAAARRGWRFTALAGEGPDDEIDRNDAPFQSIGSFIPLEPLPSDPPFPRVVFYFQTTPPPQSPRVNRFVSIRRCIPRRLASIAVRAFAGLFLALVTITAAAQEVTTVHDGVVGDDMEMGPDGMLYTTHYTGTAVRRLSPNGDVTILRDDMPSLGAIAVDPGDGTIFVTNYDEGWVMRLGPDGRASEVLATGLAGPAGIEIDRDGSLLVTANQAHAILRIPRKGGEPEIVAQGEPLHWPTGFTVADDGTLWIANMFRAEIVRLERGGQPRIVASLPRGQGRFQLAYMDAVGDRALVAHLGTDAIYEVSADGSYRVVAGGKKAGRADGAGAQALFDDPGAVVAAGDGRVLYVTDAGDRTPGLRRIELPPAGDSGAAAGRER